MSQNSAGEPGDESGQQQAPSRTPENVSPGESGAETAGPGSVAPGSSATPAVTSVTGAVRAVPPAVIDPHIQDLRMELAQAVCDLQDLAEACGEPDQRKLIRESLAAVNGPFRFVILGEVNSGKSSFVNALLQANICETAPEPCTDSIQEIVYSESPTTEVIGQNRKRLGRPIPILRTIAIVDTPGSNSVVDNHEVIAREYVPHSDLVIFVFPARNPHTRSAWDLLRYVRQEWSRKVIFVLAQKDTEPDYLERQLQSVRDYAVQGGIATPTIFATSARLEQKGMTAESGFAEVRNFIRESITGGRHIAHKLEGHTATTRKVLSGIEKKLGEARAKFEADKAFRDRIRARLGQGQERSTREVEDLVARLLEAYDVITAQFKEEFRQGMGVWSVVRRSLPGGTTNQEWLNDLTKRLEASLDKKVNQVASEEAQRFVDAIQRLIVELMEETKRDAKPSETAGTLNRLEQQRQEILRGITGRLEALARDQEPLHRGLGTASRHVGQAIVGGGLLTGVGAIVGTVTHVALFDVTGGVLATLGIAVAGAALLWKRGRIVDDFGAALEQGKAQFARELRDKLQSDLRGIYSVIDEKFADLDLLLQAQEKDLPPKLRAAESIAERLEKLRNKLATLAIVEV